MNRRASGSMTLSRATEGFLQYKAAEGLSPNTLQGYQRDLKLWLEYAGDVAVSKITTHQIQAYLVWLRTDYEPRRFSGDKQALASKTIHNCYISLSAFFGWASREFEQPNPVKAVPVPKFEQAPPEPFTRDEVEALLKACEQCRESRPHDRRKFTMRRASGKRDQAVIMTLLDTGLRASELSALKIGDVDLKSGKVLVKHGRAGGAKGGKGRTVFLGKAARRAVWRYLADREDGEDASAPLFLVKFDRSMNKNALRILIKHLGDRAGIKKCHPHRFRHTFAITYLRSGGDLFTLQALLGHSSLDMVQHYARIAEVDIEQAHKRASPAGSSDPPPRAPAEKQADHEAWRDVKVGCWYEAEPVPPRQQSTRQQTVTERGQLAQRATHLHYYCDLTDAKAFGELMWATGCVAQADRARELVFVCDGAAWIWNLITTHYSQAVQIVDWSHAADRLHRVAHAAFSQAERRDCWLDQTTTDLWEGRVAEVIHACAAVGRACAEAHDAEAYFTNNQARMRYDQYRQAGYLIGSGTVESSCKQIVTQRLKCSGAQWLVPGAIDTAKARAAWLSEDWTPVCTRWSALPLAI